MALMSSNWQHPSDFDDRQPRSCCLALVILYYVLGNRILRAFGLAPAWLSIDFSWKWNAYRRWVVHLIGAGSGRIVGKPEVEFPIKVGRRKMWFPHAPESKLTD
jgi:hypothetical protein